MTGPTARGGTGYADAIDLFDRSYRLQVDTLVVRDLQVRFEVKRSLNPKTPNSAKIEIFNLADSTRQRLQGMGRVFVSLEAGYAQGMSMIFRGDLREVSSTREERDWITTVTSGDGEKARKKRRLNKTYAPGAQLAQILTDTARALGVEVGNTAKLAASAQLWAASPPKALGGWAATGDALSTFDRVCRSCGLEWSIQDNALQLLPHGQPLAESGPNISEASGLIGSPELGKSGIVKCKTLMIPNLQPGRRVELDTTHVHGIYRIETVTFQGDLWGDDWGAELELKLPPSLVRPALSDLDDPKIVAYYDALSSRLQSVAKPYMERATAIMRSQPLHSQGRVAALRQCMNDMDAAVRGALKDI